MQFANEMGLVPGFREGFRQGWLIEVRRVVHEYAVRRGFCAGHERATSRDADGSCAVPRSEVRPRSCDGVEIWRFDDWVAFDAESITAVFVSHYQQDVRAVVGRWHSVGVFRVGLNM